MVLADSGGSNAARVRCFKYALQTRLADPYQLTVSATTPAGASKWNPIDHRLFSEISKNWAGHPLRSYQTILNHIRTTSTATGLRVHAELVDDEYHRGVKITDAEFASIDLKRHRNPTATQLLDLSAVLNSRKAHQNRHLFLRRPLVLPPPRRRAAACGLVHGTRHMVSSVSCL